MVTNSLQTLTCNRGFEGAGQTCQQAVITQAFVCDAKFGFCFKADWRLLKGFKCNPKQRSLFRGSLQARGEGGLN